MQPIDKNANKAAPEPPAKQAAARTAPAQTAKASAPAPAAPRPASSLIAASGLPADKLSASIISFARFFSLPLKPELLADIRRQAFSPAAAQQQPTAAEASPSEAAKTETAAKNRQTLSLAAAAAESKGVELKDRALEFFAETIDPEWEERQEGDGQQRQKRNKRRNEKEEGDAKKAAPITAADVKQAALEAMEKDPLLEILNRLPGKDGQRWITLPFNFEENGREYRVSLRILLPDYMALDIYSEGDKKQRQLFVLESANAAGKPSEASRLAVYLQHEISSKEQSSLVSELSLSLGIKPGRIFVKTSADGYPSIFPFEAGYGEDQWRRIDEAV